MPRFLRDDDYDTLVKNEIRKLLDGRAPDGTGAPVKQLAAEQFAIGQIKNWLSDRYNTAAIFNASNYNPDDRSAFIVMITIDITLYHLYSQTGNKDVPEHRSQRYQDAIDWLKNAGRGQVGADLPPATGTDEVSDLRISSTPTDDNRW